MAAVNGVPGRMVCGDRRLNDAETFLRLFAPAAMPAFVVKMSDRNLAEEAFDFGAQISN
jgi:hypothetical protein